MAYSMIRYLGKHARRSGVRGVELAVGVGVGAEEKVKKGTYYSRP